MTISRSDFLHRIMKYCADAERSTFDVLAKLNAWGVPSVETDEILRKLYAEKFVDDNRFAARFVSEKWKLDRWGKIKIKHALQQKSLDEKIIHDALDKIDSNEYVEGLHELLAIKQKAVKSGNKMEDGRRILMFALSRGFEEDLIIEWLGKEGYEIKL